MDRTDLHFYEFSFFYTIIILYSHWRYKEKQKLLVEPTDNLPKRKTYQDTVSNKKYWKKKEV